MYSEKVMDHFSNPRNVGEIEDASGVGTVGNAKCGDIMRIYLDIDEETKVIKDCKFKTFGCGAAVATSSMATELLEEQTDKLDFLLQSMVKMSRLENGIIRIRKEKNRLKQTLTAAVSQIVPAASKKSLQLHVTCDEDFILKYDAKWTEEAIFNVLDNAVKYTNFGGCIYVRVIRQEIFTKISIQDTGKGILPERQAEIFSRFYREPEIHDVNGVGIGLYLTRKILELQNGYIEVRSEKAKGSEFCMYLPNEA